MNALIGQTIRGYEIGDRIGSGGYGEVYRATQLSVNRDVAVKVILPQYANDPKFVADFEAEARLVAQLEHTNIVPLHDYWQDEEGAFLVMRYVRGGSLKDMIGRQGALPLARTVRLIEQIAEALAVAHDAGVVHRDLKPANILIDQRGNAYLTDFGIAKQLTGDGDSVGGGTVKGTFAYMAPEQIQGESVSSSTDIYALGVMLYEMLAGQHPFHEMPVGKLLIKHLQEPLPNIHDIRDDLPAGINDVIQQATLKAPANRYESVFDVVNDLKVAVSGTPAFVSQPAAPVQKKPTTTTAERNRDAMLKNVRKFWVEGVLENSLHDAAMIDLGLKPESGAVDSPWDTLIQTPSGTQTLSDERIVDVFDRLNGKLLILGGPGSGKTTTLLVLTRDLLRRAEVDDAHPIPMVLNLSSWSENTGPLTAWLVEELNAKYQVPRKVSQDWVDDDSLLLLLDGLDEVAPNVRDACVAAINTYRSEHGFMDVVVCSRVADYEALENQLRLNGAIIIQSLDDTQVHDYLGGLGPDVEVVRQLINRDAQLRELATSPLMLSVMVMAFRGLSVADVPDFDDLDAQRQHLFDVYVQRMLARRSGEHRYGPDETQHYLAWLAGIMSKQANSVVQIEDMQPTLLSKQNRVKFKNILRAAHLTRNVPSFMITGALAGLAMGQSPLIYALGTGLIAFTNSWAQTTSRELLRHPLLYVLVTLICIPMVLLGFQSEGLSLANIIIALIAGPMIALLSYSINTSIAQLGNDPDVIAPVEQLSFSAARVDRQAIVAGFLNGVTIAVLLTIITNRDAPPINYAIAAILTGIGLAVYFGVISGFTSETVSIRIIPNEGILRSRRNGIRLMLVSPILYALASFMVFPSVSWTTALLISISFFVQLFYISYWMYGGFTFEQHFVLRHLLRREGYIPRNLTDFLEHATSLILLRKVGGGYIFIHRYLLEYFAALETDNPER